MNDMRKELRDLQAEWENMKTTVKVFGDDLKEVSEQVNELP